MEFMYGISPLTEKSIVEHITIVRSNTDSFTHDLRNVADEMGYTITLDDHHLAQMLLVFTTTALDWANERREVSKIGS